MSIWVSFLFLAVLAGVMFGVFALREHFLRKAIGEMRERHDNELVRLHEEHEQTKTQRDTLIAASNRVLTQIPKTADTFYGSENDRMSTYDRATGRAAEIAKNDVLDQLQRAVRAAKPKQTLAESQEAYRRAFGYTSEQGIAAAQSSGSATPEEIREFAGDAETVQGAIKPLGDAKLNSMETYDQMRRQSDLARRAQQHHGRPAGFSKGSRPSIEIEELTDDE